MLQLHSPAFCHGDAIPPRHTADSDNASLPLSWSGAPPGTAELALIMEDPDAPGPEPWVHWVVYNIPPGVERLPEGIHREAHLAYPSGVTQGRNSWRRDNLGYRGPAPPEGDGPHRYRLRLYALSEPLGLEAGKSKSDLVGAMQGKILAKAELSGTYARA